MSKKQPDSGNADELGNYLPAIYARSFDQAEWYCQLLEDHDIPAIMDDNYEPPMIGGKAGRRGVPVLVPESFLAEAQECIRELENMEDFTEEDNDADDDEEEELGLTGDSQTDREEDEYF